MIKKFFPLALNVIVFALCYPAQAEQPKKVYRIGYLSRSWTESQKNQVAAFKQGLSELGYIEGKNYVIEYRNAKNKRKLLPAAAAELVQLPVDIIVTSPGRNPIRAAQKATRTIPIVMAGSRADPIDAGFVDSLAKPGRNITGLTDLRAKLHGKRLEILKEAIPEISRVVILWNRRERKRWGKETEAVGPGLGIQIRSLVLHPRAIEESFSATTRENPDGLLIATGAGGPAGRHLARIIDFVMKRRFPTIHLDSQFVDAGGLMAYGTDVPDLYRQAATYVDKILMGANPAHLPVEQPRKFELVINLKTAKQLGVTIPPSLLLQATKVIK